MKLTLTLTVNEKEITLTLDEAKDLHRQLETLFGSADKGTITYPVWPQYPVYPMPTWTCDCLDGANVNQEMLDEIHGYKT